MFLGVPRIIRIRQYFHDLYQLNVEMRPAACELTGSGHRLTFIPNRLADARMGDVIVVAEFAEGISAAFHATVRADRRAAVRTFSHGSLAARHTNVVISEFNLTE